MRPIITIILAILLAIGAIEGLAWWWMHPAPAGLDEPVLAYRPEIRSQESGVRDQESVGLDRRAGPLVANGVESQGDAEVRDQEPGVRGQEEAPAQSSSPNQNLKSNIQNPASGGSSYGQILRSSSIIGGATGINYIIGMVRTKTAVVKRSSLPS